MLKMNWQTVTGTQEKRPELVDATSSPTTVYIRKNVRREIVNQEAEPFYAWAYEEAALSREEYAEYEEMVAQIEAPAMQALKEQNTMLAQALADIYERVEAQESTGMAILSGLAEIYEAQEGGTV